MPTALIKLSAGGRENRTDEQRGVFRSPGSSHQYFPCTSNPVSNQQHTQWIQGEGDGRRTALSNGCICLHCECVRVDLEISGCQAGVSRIVWNKRESLTFDIGTWKLGLIGTAAAKCGWPSTVPSNTASSTVHFRKRFNIDHVSAFAHNGVGVWVCVSFCVRLCPSQKHNWIPPYLCWYSRRCCCFPNSIRCSLGWKQTALVGRQDPRRPQHPYPSVSISVF